MPLGCAIGADFKLTRYPAPVPSARCPPREQNPACAVWMAPALQGVCEGLACLVGVQSCVRPVCAVMTAGPDGFRGRAPILLCGLRRPGHYGGLFSSPVRPVRHHFTWSSQPLRAIPRLIDKLVLRQLPSRGPASG